MLSRALSTVRATADTELVAVGAATPFLIAFEVAETDDVPDMLLDARSVTFAVDEMVELPVTLDTARTRFVAEDAQDDCAVRLTLAFSLTAATAEVFDVDETDAVSVLMTFDIAVTLERQSKKDETPWLVTADAATVVVPVIDRIALCLTRATSVTLHVPLAEAAPLHLTAPEEESVDTATFDAVVLLTILGVAARLEFPEPLTDRVRNTFAADVTEDVDATVAESV
jgi:hypothetical protein